MKETTKDSQNIRSKTDNEEKKWIPLCQRKSLNILRIYAICANQISTNFVWNPLSVLTAPMCRKLGLSHFSISLILLIGPISGFIIPPIVSGLSDTTTLKFGRRRIYLIIGEILVIIGLPMIGFCREISIYFNPLSFLNSNRSESSSNSTNIEATFYFVTGEILAYVGGNIINGPGRAMCTEVVPPSQKVLATSFIALDSAITSLVSNSIGAFKLYRYTSMTNETFVLIVSCFVGIIAMVVSVISTREEPLKIAPKSINPITVMIDSVRSVDRNIVFILISNFFYCFSYSQFYGQGANYIAVKLFGGYPNDPEGKYDAGISYYQFLMLFLTCSQFFFSTINTKIIKRIGFKTGWTIAMTFQTVTNILLFVIDSKKYIFIPYLLAGFTTVMNNTVPLTYVSLNAPQDRIAGYVTLLILTNNVSVMLANLFLHMYLGSLPFFEEDPGRLIALGSVFSVMSLITSRIGYGHKIKSKENKEKED